MANADDDIGTVVLACRPIPVGRWVATKELGAVGAYILAPLLILPLFAFWPALGALFLVEDAPQWARIAVFTITFAAGYASLFWFTYFQPRGDHLVLGSKGFRVRMGLKHRRALFSELSSITFGLESAILGTLISLIS